MEVSIPVSIPCARCMCDARGQVLLPTCCRTRRSTTPLQHNMLGAFSVHLGLLRFGTCHCTQLPVLLVLTSCTLYI